MGDYLELKSPWVQVSTQEDNANQLERAMAGGT